MRCAGCGYYNLPGVQTCGQCHRPASESARPAQAPEPPLSTREIYPPRASDRTRGQKTEAALGRPLRQARRVGRTVGDQAQQVADNIGARRQDTARYYRWRMARMGAAFGPMPRGTDVPQSLRQWTVSFASALPGVGQLMQRRLLIGVAHLAGAALLTLLFLVSIHRDISTLFLWGLGFLSCYSVWDAANREFPPASDDGLSPMRRALRLGLMSVGTVATIFSGILWLSGQWYPIYNLNTDRAMPLFMQGDGLLLRSLNHPITQLHRGDIIVATPGEQPLVERVLGLPGDRVEYTNGNLEVNGAPPVALPITWPARFNSGSVVAPPTTFDITTPAGQVCVWRMIAGTFYEGVAAGGPSYMLVDEKSIAGRVIGIYDPPTRRRLFR